MTVNRELFLFVERYAPRSIDECILPKTIKETFIEIVNSGKVPNLLLSGPPGIGKTSTIRAVVNQLDLDFYYVNGSDEGRFLDTIRNGVTNFCSTVSMFSDKRKLVLIDEADNTSADVQMSLRALIEKFQNNVSFVFTCNYKNRLIDPLQSRCAVIDFSIPSKEKPVLAGQFFKRVLSILEENNIQYEEKVVAKLVQKHFPDWRRCLNELQRYSQSGKIDVGILAGVSEVQVTTLIEAMKNKEFTTVRKWVVENLDNDPQRILRKVYESLYEHVKPQSIPQGVLIVADYMQKATMAVDPEVNLLAFSVEIMMSMEWK